MGGCVGGWMSGCMGGWMGGWMKGWVCRWVDEAYHGHLNTENFPLACFIS